MSSKAITIALFLVCLGICAQAQRERRFGVDALVSKALDQSRYDCSSRGGCYYGYCWAGCSFTGAFKEWCYTTKGNSFNHQYVKCSSDADCNTCWSCAGRCGAI